MPTLVYANIPPGNKAFIYALSPRVYKTDLHIFHQNRVIKTLTKTKYDRDAAAWLAADGQEVVQLGDFPQGAQLGLQMCIQKTSQGTVVTPYELNTGTLHGNTIKFGADNPYDGLGQADMIVVSWSPIEMPAPTMTFNFM